MSNHLPAKCRIRPAIAGDESLLLEFIRGLAEYEKLEGEMVA